MCNTESARKYTRCFDATGAKNCRGGVYEKEVLLWARVVEWVRRVVHVVCSKGSRVGTVGGCYIRAVNREMENS